MDPNNFNPADMFGKIQEMQEQMQKVRDSLDQVTVEAEAGGGMVKVTATANKRVTKVHIEPEVYDDKEMLEDLLIAATNKALEMAEEKGSEELKKATQSMLPNIPGLDLSQMGL